MSPKHARKRLARIRCLLEAVKCIQDGTPLPKQLCFIPQQVDYLISQDALSNKPTGPVRFMVWSKPSSRGGKLIGRLNIPETKFKDYFLTVFGHEYSDDEGDWSRLTPATIAKHQESIIMDSEEEAWITLHARDARSEKIPLLIARHEHEQELKSQTSRDDLFGVPSLIADHKKNDTEKKGKLYYKWQSVVESSYMLHVVDPTPITNMDAQAVKKLSTPPPNWCIEADEELVRFLVEHSKGHEASIGGASKYVSSVLVSTEQDSANNLLDGDPDTFWESDGSLGRHYIRLHMKPNVVVQQLIIGVDPLDDNYMPSRVVVHGMNEAGPSKMLRDCRIDSNTMGDVVVFENATEAYQTIEIRIKECKDDGIDCRIHYVKIISSKQKENGLNRALFDRDLVRYPKLESIVLKDRDVLYNRALALLRFATLLDSVIHFLLPTWEYTAGTFRCLEATRQLLPLSKKRHQLIENCLRESQGICPSQTPKIYINRHLAAEHLVDPTQDLYAKNAIFHQLYEALRPERCEVKLDFRWPQKYDQWWECKFVGEGIIDQGGGFRDSLSDMAEELCPSSPDSLLPLQYFVRTPNQVQSSGTSNVNRDCYVPNSTCQLFTRYEWIGQLMGACLRGKENLIVSFPPFIWKLLNGEKVSWESDYYSIDTGEVKFHDELKSMSKEKFSEVYQGTLSYMTVLCDGREIPLKDKGHKKFVDYDEREEYIRLVQEKRLKEFNGQVNALRRGLEKVVPKAVLSLMTWQELERRICGDPEITVEALKKSAHYEDFDDENDVTIKYLWQALENFTNEDRSRFLRFVTGRRRLPTPLYICRSKSFNVNSLPESATCSSTLFLPRYSSSAMAEEKLRYAAYTCIAIDADMSPWED